MAPYRREKSARNPATTPSVAKEEKLVEKFSSQTFINKPGRDMSPFNNSSAHKMNDGTEKETLRLKRDLGEGERQQGGKRHE